jgi:hypothetical protein
MLQVIFRYDDRIAANTGDLYALGHRIRPLIAQVASTDEVLLTEQDVDWLPVANEPGSICREFAVFEITTIGYPDRKAKMGEGGMATLKWVILGLDLFQVVDPAKVLIRVQFTDPAGVHV